MNFAFGADMAPLLNRTDMARLSRRLVLQGAAALGVLTAVGTSLKPAMASASDLSDRSGDMNIDELIAALRATGRQVCLQEADRVEASIQTRSEYNLHLRAAGLELRDAVEIADAMQRISGRTGMAMRSFSISYNQGVGDDGAIALAYAIPATLTDLGMVGCALGDRSGEALLAWAPHATELRMICVEGNDFSPEMRQRISALRNNRNGVMVIV